MNRKSTVQLSNSTFRRIFQLGVDDVVLLCSPYTFDPSVVEVGPDRRSEED